MYEDAKENNMNKSKRPNLKLMLGDCLEKMPKLAANSFDLVLCDPPYGTTQCKWDSIIPLTPMWKQLERLAKPDAAIVMTACQPFTSILGASGISWLKYSWVWDKGQGTGHLNAKKMPMKNTEDILVFYKSPPTYNPQMRTGFKPYKCKQGKTKSQNYGKQTGAFTVSDGTRYPLNLLSFKRNTPKLHPTQKPVALMEYLIKTYTNEGDRVLDFAMGSGTTGVACKKLNRKFVGIELDEGYFEIAKKRIEETEC